jgi:sugar phosphate isomerase/epimerase
VTAPAVTVPAATVPAATVPAATGPAATGPAATGPAVTAPGLGVHASSLADHRLDVPTALREAAARGFAACLFGSVFDLSPRLDPAEIADVNAIAAGQGVRVAVGSVSLHPWRAGADDRLLAAGDGDALSGLRRMLEASAMLAERDLLTIIGRVEDRYDRLIPWAEQLRAAGIMLRRLAPLLRDAGLRLLVKTHEEITADEVARLIDQVGDDVVGVALDPVNLLVIVFAGGAARRLLCAVGDGIVDWPGVIATTRPRAPTWWVELHRGQFTVAPFDPDWIAHHPGLTREALGEGVRQVCRSTRELGAGQIKRLYGVQARPARRLTATATAARELLAR